MLTNSKGGEIMSIFIVRSNMEGRPVKAVFTTLEKAVIYLKKIGRETASIDEYEVDFDESKS
jgi:hypothetical protein